MSVDDPLQWDNWVKVHARHCTEAMPGTIDQVHWTWFFLPWHRAYLWFLERHLANIISKVLGGDGSGFALPYWDWITHKEIPNTKSRFTDGTPSPLFGFDLTKEDMVNDDKLGFDNLALWDGYRKPTLQEPTMDPRNERSIDSKEHIELTRLYMSPEYIKYTLDLDFEDFAGRAVPAKTKIPDNTGMGMLEQNPHNFGHDWVGSRFGKNRDMGSLRYAALDPIFFMHHANIDRIWSLYRGVQPDPHAPWGPNKYVWGQQSYTFVDIDGTQVTVTVGDIVTKMTNVTYEEPQPLSSAKASLLSALPSRRQASSQTHTIVLVQQPGMLTTRPLTMDVTLPAQTLRVLGSMIAKGPKPLALLVIETGPVVFSGKFSIKVFVDKPDADAATSIHDPHYIGTIRALDSGGRINEDGKAITHSFSVIIPPEKSNFYEIVKPGTAAFSITLAVLGPSSRDESFRILVKSVKLKVYPER